MHVIAQEMPRGPVNVAAPAPVTNTEFTEQLGRLLHRPTIFTAPEFAVKLFLREMGEEMLLAGARVVPQRLLDSGYRFQHTELGAALKSL
jgi:NAD dependent epimerase/dehydratase family enzyme